MKWLRYLAPVLLILCFGAIYYLSSEPGMQTASTTEKIILMLERLIRTDLDAYGVFLLRQFGRVVLFFALGIFTYLTFHNFLLEWEFLAMPLVIIYGCLDEWRKQFIIGRHFQLEEMWLNVMSSISGVFVVCVAIYLLNRRKEKRSLQ